MSFQSVFPFAPAEWLPIRDQALLDSIYDADLTKKKGPVYENPEFEFQIVYDVRNYFAADLFHRIRMSQVQDKKLVLVLPSPENVVYISVTENLNKYRVNCKNLHVFFTAEFANEKGEVAPPESPYSRSGQFMRYFYDRLDEELRMPLSQIHFWTKENTEMYSGLLAEEGGADVIYSSLSWSGGIGFIDAESFPAADMKQLLSMGSRHVAVSHETLAQESLRGMFGMSGDLGGVPPFAVTIGPLDFARAKYAVHTQFLANCGGSPAYQRIPLRLALLGPVAPENPGALMRLFPGVCFAATNVAAPCARTADAPWLDKTLAEIRAKEEK